MRRRDVSASLGGLLLTACGPRVGAQSRPSAEAFYACEGCEGATEARGVLAAATRLGRENEPGEPLLLNGVVYRPDRRTPAPGVIVYAYHTNPVGLYADGGATSEAARLHGRLRGWVRTGSNGRYSFNTIKPGVYPDRRGPAHIHLIIVEPGRRPYWVDSVVFEGEFGVTPAYSASHSGRGGSGIVRLRTGDGRLLAERDITLEVHPQA